MQSRNDEQKLAKGQTKVKNSRFKIAKLEERIAPRHARGHYPGYPSGNGYGRGGSGGHCGHGACK